MEYYSAFKKEETLSFVTTGIGLEDNELSKICQEIPVIGIPGWRSGLVPAFGSGRDPGDPGLNPTSGSRCMEPASPSACVSASLSLCVCVTIRKKKLKLK